MKEKAKSDVGVQGYTSIITNYKLQITNYEWKEQTNEELRFVNGYRIMRFSVNGTNQATG
jgi:hypothetical protein